MAAVQGDAFRPASRLRGLALTCRSIRARSHLARCTLPAHRRRRPSRRPLCSGDEPASSGEAPQQEPVKLLSVSVSAAPDVETAGLQLVKGAAVPVGQALHLQCASSEGASGLC